MDRREHHRRRAAAGETVRSHGGGEGAVAATVHARFTAQSRYLLTSTTRPIPRPLHRFILAAGMPLQGKPVAHAMKLQAPKPKPGGAPDSATKKRNPLQGQNLRIWTVGQAGAPAFEEQSFDVLRYMLLERGSGKDRQMLCLELHAEREPSAESPQTARHPITYRVFAHQADVENPTGPLTTRECQYLTNLAAASALFAQRYDELTSSGGFRRVELQHRMMAGLGSGALGLFGGEVRSAMPSEKREPPPPSFASPFPLSLPRSLLHPSLLLIPPFSDALRQTFFPGSALAPDVKRFVDYMFGEANKQLTRSTTCQVQAGRLVVPAANLTIADVEKAESVLFQAWDILRDPKASRLPLQSLTDEFYKSKWSRWPLCRTLVHLFLLVAFYSFVLLSRAHVCSAAARLFGSHQQTARRCTVVS